jgi:hypothetical protein
MYNVILNLIPGMGIGAIQINKMSNCPGALNLALFEFAQVIMFTRII